MHNDATFYHKTRATRDMQKKSILNMVTEQTQGNI